MFVAGRFDLVIVDRAMPVMNGEQVAMEIKKISPATPVILLTGFGDLMNAAGEMPPGIDLVVGKPVTLKVLRDSITKALLKTGKGDPEREVVPVR